MKPESDANNTKQYGANPENESGRDRFAQLSETQRVTSVMGSVAIDGMLPQGSRGASVPRTSAGEGVRVRRTDPAALDGLTDAEIMLRVKAGDDAAFNFLIEKFRRPLISFMYRMTHNSATAEELAQEVFLRIYRSRVSYAADAKFTTWMYRIATNLAVNHARDTRNQRPEVTVSIDESDEASGPAIDVADATPNIEQRLLRRERLEAIRNHVNALPERQRAAVLMHKYQEMDYRQIAQALHLSESATKSLLFRAYETLRDKLKEFV
ncbi:MAG TPA: RNA polymerase sigma factor [Clostridia bacterium]|nr:RNA polymerase sigma factor [Clostridia bacterium]